MAEFDKLTRPLTLDERLDFLEMYPTAVKKAIADAGDRLVDVVGVITTNTRQVAEQKKMAVSELVTGERGQRWSIEQGRKADRSYNTPGILAALLADYDGTLLELLLHLRTIDVVRLSWQWTKLDKFANDLGVELRKSRVQIEDDDDTYLVGEVWGDGSASFQPINEEDDGKQDT